MLTMCPNCRHRFPVPGCCNPGPQGPSPPVQDCAYYGSLLVPRGYTGGGCFINAPTIIQGPAIIQSGPAISAPPTDMKPPNSSQYQSDVQINTTCDLTGGTVTITTPNIQSGGCLIQSTESGYLLQAPTIEIRPKLSGGSCVVQKRLSTDCTESLPNVSFSDEPMVFKKPVEVLTNPPSGCQELPGMRSSESTQKCCCSSRPASGTETIQAGASPEGVQIHVNATVQLPRNVGHCTVNITATQGNPPITRPTGSPSTVRVRNNFNGGGLMGGWAANETEGPERREDAPSTPLSWLTPCPWFDGFAEKNSAKMQEVKRLLGTSGWYHEGLSWQQSETLLKNSEIGRWLLRDSSDNRYVFAVSVQTTRGPTSVRIIHAFGRFRLDAEPTIAHAMPTFDCPIKMLDYYIEYSKRIEESQRHVWVDYSGLLFSHIYLTEPVVKEVRSLSHLARLALDRGAIEGRNLPAPIRNYINEYPYSF